MPSAEDIRHVYDSYIAALLRHDLEAVMAMFAADAVLHDPVDGSYSEVELGNGITIIETIDVMTFDEDGKVSTMTAYWGPTNMRPA